MPDPSLTLPDVLETLGMSIAEVGAIQVGTDRALRTATGEGRITVVLQSAWSGALEVQVTVKAPAEGGVTRKVALAHGEVRRLRLPVKLPEGVASVSLGVVAAVPSGAHRIRNPWLRDGAGSTSDSSMWGIFVGALRQAVGRGGRDAPPAAAEGQVEIPIEPQSGGLAVAAEEEAVWQVGMEGPPPSEVSARPAEELLPKRAPPPLVEPGPIDERLACPRCGAKSFAELIKARQQCPVCGQTWNV